MKRTGSVKRTTRETDILVNINIDGSGDSSINTGIGFFDHMLYSFARHGLFNLQIEVDGDLMIDTHHTVEDTGIVLGESIKSALGEKEGIKRYGFFILPMDDAVILCSLDLSGRYSIKFDYEFATEKIGELETETIREFFSAVACQAGMNLHIHVLAGNNSHHIVEAMFKAFAKALDMATDIDNRVEGAWSTKGSL